MECASDVLFKYATHTHTQQTLLARTYFVLLGTMEQTRGDGMGLRIGQREGGGQGAVVMFAALLCLPRQKPAVPAWIERPVPADKGAFAGMFQAVTPFDGLLGKARAVVRTKRQFGDILARHQRPKPRRGAIRLL